MCTFRILTVLYFSIIFSFIFYWKKSDYVFPSPDTNCPYIELHTFSFTIYLEFKRNKTGRKWEENSKTSKKKHKKYINKTNKNTRSERIICSQNHPTRKTNPPQITQSKHY